MYDKRNVILILTASVYHPFVWVKSAQDFGARLKLILSSNHQDLMCTEHV
jgi:hypothetical protein